MHKGMVFRQKTFGDQKTPPHSLRKESSLATYRVWLWWPLMAFMLCTLSVMTLSLAEASQEENNSGQMEFRDASGTLSDALLARTDVKMTITGMVATVTYQQEFHNTSQAWVEGRYLFPLPETAAVSAMTMRVGERLIVGEIKEKQEARKIYQQAKKAGQRAALTEQQRPNMFTQTIANVGPGEHIQVTLTYRQTVDYEYGQFSLRLPLTITPRYIPGATSTSGQSLATSPLEDDTESDPFSQSQRPKEIQQETSDIALDNEGWGWALPTDQVPDAHLITPFMTPNQHRQDGSIRNPVSIHIDLDAGLPLARIDSPYHDIVIQKQDKQHSIKLSKGRVPMDRDFVLTWRAVSQQTPRAALFTEHVDDQQTEGSDYLLLMLFPPQSSDTQSATTQETALPRDVTFIVDTSGSMGGTSIEQAKASLQLALTTLTDRDRFNIVEFNSHFHHYSPHPQTATVTNRRRAQHFVAGLRATGGTEMYAPLDAVLSEPTGEAYLKQIVFITDGSVGNESALFQLIESKLGDARLFMVGIGSAPNSYFMRKSAQFGRGTFIHVGNLAEVSEKMSALFNQLQSPVLRDIQIDWPAGLTPEVYPTKHPDLYRGQPLLLKAKTRQALHGTLTVSGLSSHGRWSQSLKLQSLKSPPLKLPPLKLPYLKLQPTAENTDLGNGNGIASLWARDKIAALMDQKHTGTSEADIKPLVLEVALAHQLMSAYTSFVAVDKTPARPIEKPITPLSIANQVAKGQAVMAGTTRPKAAQTAYTYPQTALGLNGQLLLGTVCLLLATLMMITRRTRQARHMFSHTLDA